eukprot:TRINITY_DN21457_c0_g1_i1.p1 TRINITY_DN21457_c0_g1~~TRINITY_DN21457_c0_g1_i1.p1  ORF type:complete len:349 (-),score=39.93 TRINITY_DN21457_c0_g1_i1:221-1267(-)
MLLFFGFLLVLCRSVAGACPRLPSDTCLFADYEKDFSPCSADCLKAFVSLPLECRLKHKHNPIWQRMEFECSPPPATTTTSAATTAAPIGPIGGGSPLDPGSQPTGGGSPLDPGSQSSISERGHSQQSCALEVSRGQLALLQTCGVARGTLAEGLYGSLNWNYLEVGMIPHEKSVIKNPILQLAQSTSRGGTVSDCITCAGSLAKAWTTWKQQQTYHNCLEGGSFKSCCSDVSLTALASLGVSLQSYAKYMCRQVFCECHDASEMKTYLDQKMYFEYKKVCNNCTKPRNGLPGLPPVSPSSSSNTPSNTPSPADIKKGQVAVNASTHLRGDATTILLLFLLCFTASFR